MSEDMKKIEETEQEVKTAELSEQELDDVAGGGGAGGGKVPILGDGGR